jgi:predicted SnoaL-like aldol condensation-catalyzing enzyme
LQPTWHWVDVTRPSEEQAAQRYLVRSYRQHNPQAGDGAAAFIQFVTGFLAQVPQLSVDIKRTIAEGDFVVTHCLLKMSPQDRGTAVMDIFQLADGKIAEHWDVLQPVPETAANANTMF